MDDSSFLRVGTIGFGLRGGLLRHVETGPLPARVVACADPSDTARRRFLELFPKAWTTDAPERLLERTDLDAVFVLSPDHLHEAHAVAALEAGKAVYLEKPMAISTAGCDRILDTAWRHRARLYVGHNLRHHPVMLKMKELIDSGAIGEVKTGWCRHFVCYGGDAYFKDWHAERAKATSLLLQKGAHDIDVLHWLCGGHSARVVGMGGLTLYDRVADRHAPDTPGDASWHVENWPALNQKGLNPTIDVEDLSLMLMTLDNGVFCSYHQCHYAPDGWRNYTIIGTEGRLENINDRPGEAVVRVWNRRVMHNPYGDEQHFIPASGGGHGGADPNIVAEFVRFATVGGRTATSPVAARFSVAAGCAAAHSLRHGAIPVDIPALPPALLDHYNSGQPVL